MNINKKITAWQNAGLITQNQGDEIALFEKNNAKPYVFYGLLVLSFFCIGLGVISVIAANWNVIPPMVKLLGDFILLALCAGGMFYFYKQKKLHIFDALLILFALLNLATIGLIAQLYQLQPDGLSAYLLWSLLMLPLIGFCRFAGLPFVWLPIFLVSFESYIQHNHILEELRKLLLSGWKFSIPLIGLYLLAIIYQLLSTLTQSAQGLRHALKWWLIVIIALTIIWFGSPAYLIGFSQTFNPFVKYGSIVIASILIGLSTYLDYRFKRQFLIPYMLSLTLIGSLIYLNFVLSFLALAGLGFYAYKIGSRQVLNTTLVLAVLRILGLYIDLFGSLLYTGTGLIIFGLGLLFIVWQSVKIFGYLKGRLEHA